MKLQVRSSRIEVLSLAQKDGRVKFISRQAQPGIIALGYAAAFVVAASLLYGDHLWELKNPDEASGGMHAFGDTVLYIFIVCLFMIPTGFLIWFVARFDAFYTSYSRFLLGLSLSAPICLGLLFLGENRVGERFISLFLYRLLWAPFILAGIGFSWLMARLDRAKRLISYAFLVEGLTIAIAVGLLILEAGSKKR